MPSNPASSSASSFKQRRIEKANSHALRPLLSSSQSPPSRSDQKELEPPHPSGGDTGPLDHYDDSEDEYHETESLLGVEGASHGVENMQHGKTAMGVNVIGGTRNDDLAHHPEALSWIGEGFTGPKGQ